MLVVCGSTVLTTYGDKKKRRALASSSASLCGGYLLSHLRSTIGVTGLNFSVRNG